MRFRFLSIGFAIVLSSGMVSQAFAGGQPLSCYEQAVVPAAYKVVQKRVLVQPERRRLVKTPAVYGYQKRRVLAQPERITYRKTAPVYQKRHRKVMVQPARTGWEYQMRKGRKILCKVQYPAVYQTVAETVLVKPAGKVKVRQPAIFSTVNQKVLVRPASSHYVTEPAVYSFVKEHVKVRDAQTVWRPVSTKCAK